MNDDRPNPDRLLERAKKEESRESEGRLRVFLGMSAGVGKTFAMLKAAHARLSEGVDVVVGVVETHSRVETTALVTGLPLIPKKKSTYKNVLLEEMDIDSILSRKPKLVLVDELAHSNVPGSRHSKRYQDVLELLTAGIDVFTTVNIQHLESRKDLVEKMTGVAIRETVPDSVIERADQIEVVDISPAELLKRLKEGKVYLGDKADRAAENFFKLDSLTALREIALRFTAEKVDHELQQFHELRNSASPWQTNERLMVAVSHSPYTERLIRTTRRFAYTLEAPWVALYVDSGISLSKVDQDQLAKNLNLARELKAEVVTTSDIDIPTALKRVARQKNITQIIIGRPSRRFVRDILEGGSLLDKLVRESWDIDVHVIRQSHQPKFTSWPRPTFESGFLSYWNTFWLLAGVGLLSGLVEPFIGYKAVGFLFMLAVLGVGRLGSFGPVIFSALLSAVAWNFFFIPPRLTFAISSAEDFILCFTYFVVAVLMGALTHRLKKNENLLREREARANVLYEVLKDISTSHNKSEYLKSISHRVGQVLDGECGVLLKDMNGRIGVTQNNSYLISLSEKELAVAQWTFDNRKWAGWSTETLSQTKELFVPLVGANEMMGVFVYRPNGISKLSIEQENLLTSVCSQLALSVERHFYEKRLFEAEKLKESEKLHQTLLNSISHEMRTPLTAILGAASALSEDLTNSDIFRKTIARDVATSGDRLNRVIENLLDMSRLNSGALAIKKEWHDVSDLVGVTVKRLDQVLLHHLFRIEIGKDIPLVEMDFRLMEHAISNLIVNAVNHTSAGTSIQLIAMIRDKNLLILVQDSGPGISSDALPHVFEKFYRAPGTPAGGIGLGLSIVKSIVEFHGGDLTAENRIEGGARFTISLPLGQPPAGPSEG